MASAAGKQIKVTNPTGDEVKGRLFRNVKANSIVSTELLGLEAVHLTVSGRLVLSLFSAAVFDVCCWLTEVETSFDYHVWFCRLV